jgi:tetratricopeptide (TPR) repeat protein
MQLDLFSDWLAAKKAAEVSSEASPLAGNQLDLFDGRSLCVAGASRALCAFELDAACDDLQRLASRYPQDGNIASSLALAGRLRDTHRRALQQNPDPLSALATLEPELPPHLETGWHRRMAAEAERLLGEGCTVGDVPAGLHWLSAGDAASAERSLRATLGRRPEDGRARGYLGDALFAQGQVERARREYARAFAEAPREMDLGLLLDPEVRSLPEIARLELEVEGDGRDWAAALGTVRGVFALPDLLLPGLPELSVGAGAEPGLEFLAALRAERRARSLDDRVAARRVMKRLCPALFAEYLGPTPGQKTKGEWP